MRFFVEYLKSPRDVSSIIPSSRCLVRRVLRHLPRDARVIVEFGPGTGVISAALLRQLPADGRLVLIEKLPAFVSILRDMFAHDPRVIVACDSAERVAHILAEHGIDAVDGVVSGIPFSQIPADTCRAILRATVGVLRPGVPFVAYQIAPAVGGYMREAFGACTCEVEWWNIPPLRVWVSCA